MLTNHNIVLTGASSGIGLEVLKILAKGDGNVILAPSLNSEEKLKDFAPNVIPMNVDTGSKEGVDAVFEKADEVFGGAKRKFGVTWDTVKIGDYLRLKPHHSVFVIDSVKRGEVIGYDYYEGLNITADSSFVRVVHCNWDMQCGIRWDDYFSCDSYDLDSSQSFTMY